MESPANPELLKYDPKKMKKNGYIEVTVKIPVTGVKKGDKVFVTATEFGQIPNDGMLSCITTDKKEIIIPKKNLIID